MKQLTKTDFIQYLRCPESLWLAKNKPVEASQFIGEFSLFLEKIAQEGYEVEGYAKKLFPNGKDLPDNASPKGTKDALNSGQKVLFQASFLSESKAFARVDVLEKLDDNSFHLYEVKSSTSIKTDKKHNHLKDACFQKYVLEECGLKVSKVSIIHLNPSFKKEGVIKAQRLLTIQDVTEFISEMYSSTLAEINSALKYLKTTSINESQCSCRSKTRSNHCDTFFYFNSDIPEYSIYEIARISAKKIQQLLDLGVVQIADVPEDFDLNTRQRRQVESVKDQKIVFNKSGVRNTLSALSFPLHFVDYETFASAIPKTDGLGPHRQMVFQVSVHTLLENGQLTHFEWLGDQMELPVDMLAKMQEFTELSGTFVSWNAPFEMGRNSEMMRLIPQFENYLKYMNGHMYDLMEVFKQDYVDYRFRGSTSIKKVLPVVCPEFSYSDLKIQDGGMALDTWGRLMLDANFLGDPQETRKNLLDYCRLDTLAMVEIYRYLMGD
ncbi:hypothetical protein BST99_11615 [Aureicoccus marinus]|uniref:DUF2779 domain-containing protein n=2 Tax=Aureicoccus marinus TaxID=754435 RepID=A0A2S7T9T5_9FLAO|nr:hypothetical protein BST99_11615 [Aureicoccus marinus]